MGGDAMKPAPLAYYDCQDLLRWLDQDRPGAAAYVRRQIKERFSGSLMRLDLVQNVEDMREHPAAYAKCGYAIEDLDWLRAELGDEPRVHGW